MNFGFIQKIVLYTFFGLLFFVSAPAHSFAALLYFDPGEVNIYRGDTVTLDLRIDTDEGECINTVDAVINYDSSVKAVDVSRGASILNIWVENPVIDEKEHTITFAGGIPGGYCGRVPGDPSLTNVIATLVFQSPGFVVGKGDNQFARVWIDEKSQVLLHDGYGSNANLRLQDAKISLMPNAGTENSDTWKTTVDADSLIPSDFVITLTKDDTAFSGEYFITFNAVDKQSGIDHYEVMEEPIKEFNSFTWGRADAPWVVTESPYVLHDQTLNSTIRVRALDKAGNERIGVLVPDTAMRSMSRDTLITWIIGGVVCILIIMLVAYILWRRKKKLTMEIESMSEFE